MSGQLEVDRLWDPLLLLVWKLLSAHCFVMLQARCCNTLGSCGLQQECLGAHCFWGFGQYCIAKPNTNIAMFCTLLHFKSPCPSSSCSSEVLLLGDKSSRMIFFCNCMCWKDQQDHTSKCALLQKKVCQGYFCILACIIKIVLLLLLWQTGPSPVWIPSHRHRHNATCMHIEDIRPLGLADRNCLDMPRKPLGLLCPEFLSKTAVEF